MASTVESSSNSNNAGNQETEPGKVSKVTLLSKDLVRFEVETKVARMCQTINTMLRDLEVPEDDQEPIPTVAVDARILRLIIEWSVHHVDDPVVEKTGEEAPQEAVVGKLDEWDKAFVDRLDDPTLFELIAAANFLNHERLLHVGTKAVAHMMFGLKPEEIRQRFGIADDIPQEEKERMEAENALFRSTDVNKKEDNKKEVSN